MLLPFSHRCLTKTREELAIPLSHRPVKWNTDLRTVPTFATAHTFCASLYGPKKSGFLTAVPATTEIFLRGL